MKNIECKLFRPLTQTLFLKFLFSGPSKRFSKFLLVLDFFLPEILYHPFSILLRGRAVKHYRAVKHFRFINTPIMVVIIYYTIQPPPLLLQNVQLGVIILSPQNTYIQKNKSLFLEGFDSR